MSDAPNGTPNGTPSRPPSNAPSASPSAAFRAYYELTKPGIVGYVVLVTSAAYYLASRGTGALLPLLHTAAGTGLATAGALALNQYLEREVDARMARTRSRPIPTGRVTSGAALLFSVVLFLGGIGYLWATVGRLPALLTLGSGVAYNFVYTPLKSRSYLATLVGGRARSLSRAHWLGQLLRSAGRRRLDPLRNRVPLADAPRARVGVGAP